MIEIENLYKAYGKLEVLKGVTANIEENEIFAVLGPNGSGKTTLIKCLLGMVIPQKGTLRINGEEIRGKWEYRKKISYLSQIARFPNNLKVGELVKMIQEIRPDNLTDYQTLIDKFRLQEHWKKKLGNLSGGTKQKVNLLLTFMYDSDIYILDEPTTGLDPISTLELKQIIREKKQQGKTVLITSHIMSFVEEVSTRILFLLDGTIYFSGTLEALEQQTGKNTLEEAIAKILSEEL